MNRGLAVAWSWRWPYWKRVSPGVHGGILYLLLPLLFFLPLDALPLFEVKSRGVAMLLWLFALGLALGVAAKRSAREEDGVWLFQKGVPLGEAALEDWLLDLGLAKAAALVWASVGTLALLGSGHSLPRLWLSLFFLGLATAVLVRTVVFVLSAWGIQRAVDLTVLGVFLSMVVPALTFRSSEGVQMVAGWIVPPFREVWTLAGAVRTGGVLDVAAPLLHLLVVVGLFLALGAWRISRWRPHG
jgi:hypothetical protein